MLAYEPRRRSAACGTEPGRSGSTRAADTHEATTLDLSRGGCRVFTEDPGDPLDPGAPGNLSEGYALAVAVELDDGLVLRGGRPGRARRRTGAGAAVHRTSRRRMRPRWTRRSFGSWYAPRADLPAGCRPLIGSKHVLVRSLGATATMPRSWRSTRRAARAVASTGSLSGRAGASAYRTRCGSRRGGPVCQRSGIPLVMTCCPPQTSTGISGAPGSPRPAPAAPFFSGSSSVVMLTADSGKMPTSSPRRSARARHAIRAGAGRPVHRNVSHGPQQRPGEADGRRRHRSPESG